MSGTVILAHGSDSGPDATKVSALAAVAQGLGWQALRPDFRGEDALGYAGAVAPRVARLRAVAEAAAAPRVLVGSSMGAFVAGLASLQCACAGIFLIALPTAIPGCPQAFDMARGVPAMLVHGWQDALCPADAALAFARARGMPTLLFDDDHRLWASVAAIAAQFRLFLISLAV